MIKNLLHMSFLLLWLV